MRAANDFAAELWNKTKRRRNKIPVDVWRKRQTQHTKDIGKRWGMRERREGRTDAQLSVKPIMHSWLEYPTIIIVP